MEEKVVIGKIINTFGIKGELKIAAQTDFPEERFQKGAQVFVKNEVFEIATHRVHKGYDLISFKGYQDINKVEQYKGLKLYALKDDSLLDEDEIWLNDFIGIEVYNDGKLLGPVKDLMQNTYQDILVVDYHGKSLMIPYVDAFVKNKDFEARRIDVSLIEGFIDED